MYHGQASIQSIQSAQTVAGCGAAIGVVNQQVGQCEAQMQEHDRLLHTLNDEIAVLTERVVGVLRPAMPEPQGGAGNAVPTPVRSPYASSLSEFNARLHASIQRVRDLAARADL